MSWIRDKFSWGRDFVPKIWLTIFRGRNLMPEIWDKIPRGQDFMPRIQDMKFCLCALCKCANVQNRLSNVQKHFY
jgi:hypothetical protein